MEVTFYLDVYFLTNFLTDLLLLDLVRRFFGLPGRKLRQAAAAAFGAVWACGAAVLFWRLRMGAWGVRSGGAAGLCVRALDFLLQVPVPAALMLLSAFGRVNIRAFSLRMAALLAAGVLLGGTLELAAERLPDAGKLSLPLLAAVSVLSAVLWRLLLRAVEAYRKKRRLLCRVTLQNGGRRVEVTALRDSGNRLFEPYGHEPVHVVDRRVGLMLHTPESRMTLIPYCSVGKAGGLLWGFRIERMEAADGGAERRVYERPWIALSSVRVSPQGHYEMLLHGETCPHI